MFRELGSLGNLSGWRVLGVGGFEIAEIYDFLELDCPGVGCCIFRVEI